MIPQSMHDIAVLKPLVKIGERLGIDLILFGSAATRAVLLCAVDRQPNTLFELAEHASDIDLAHTGPPALTVRLRSEIEKTVPLASWLRWSILDKKGWEEHLRQVAMNLKVPLRAVQLSTQQNLSSHHNETIEQALDGKIYFGWNKRFQFSPRAVHDTEVSAALLFCDAVVDVATLESFGREMRPQWHPEVLRTLSWAIEAGKMRLNKMNEQNAALATRRIWYRFASLAIRAPHFLGDPHFPATSVLKAAGEILVEHGYPNIIDVMKQTPSCPILLSASIKVGVFRFDPLPTNEARSADDPEAVFRTSTEKLSHDGEGYSLESGNRVLQTAINLKVRRGSAPSEPASGALSQEFVHISFGLDGIGEKMAEEDLSAIVIGHSTNSSVLLPAYAIVSKASSVPNTPQNTCRATVRLNFAGNLHTQDRIDVFLVGRSWSHEH